MQSAVSSLVTQAVNPCSTSAPFRYAVASSRQPRRPVNTAAASRGTRLCTCYTQSRAAAEPAGSEPDAESQFDRERASLRSFADNLRGEQAGSSGARSDLSSSHVGPVLERAFLVGVAQKGKTDRFAYNVHESLEELGRLAETAGLEVRSHPRREPVLPCPLTEHTDTFPPVGTSTVRSLQVSGALCSGTSYSELWPTASLCDR